MKFCKLLSVDTSTPFGLRNFPLCGLFLYKMINYTLKTNNFIKSHLKNFLLHFFTLTKGSLMFFFFGQLGGKKLPLSQNNLETVSTLSFSYNKHGKNKIAHKLWFDV